jgi:murein DD-endopeptidase MepM/ murein hydrolase activator NlpD
MRVRVSYRLCWSAAILAAVSACAAPTRGPAPVERGSAAAAPSVRTCGQSVTVRRGDTLSGLAQRCNVSLSELASENNLSPPYTLRPGQTLRIPGPATYIVRRGDNLYRIGLAHGMTAQELASLNGISTNATIHPGQELRVRGQPRQLASAPQNAGGASPRPQESASRPSQPPPPPLASAPQFAWPLNGELIARFGDNDGRRLDGIRIAARMGEPVRAAAPGEVVYAGNELQGYGELILIRHADRWVTAYGLNSTLRVSVGQQVEAGEHIADAGASGTLSRPALHFEVRRGVTPVDPLQQLPQR